MRPQPHVLLLTAALTACAGQAGLRDADGNPQLQRLDPVTLSERASRAPGKLSVSDIAAMAKSGRSAEEIVARMRATGTRLSMDETQRQTLRREGVPQATIDALVAAEAEAQRVDRLTAAVDRAAEAKRREDARREWRRTYPYDPYWPGWHPYFGYSRYGHFHGWHGGIGWGW